jgi:hypothetical protein
MWPASIAIGRQLVFIGFGFTSWPISSAAEIELSASLQMVTAEARHQRKFPPTYNVEIIDVIAYQGRDRDPVDDGFLLQGDKSRLELCVLFGDASRTNLGSQLDDIRQFVAAQPQTTAIGVGFLSRIAEQAGGEMYFIGFDTPPSFGPHLDDLARKLHHRYLLASSGKKMDFSGPGLKLRSQYRVNSGKKLVGSGEKT